MEIGSIFEFENYTQYTNLDKQDLRIPFWKDINKHYNIFFYQNARNAIEALIRGMNDLRDRIFIVPDFICETVTDALLRGGAKILTYEINKQFEPNISQINDLVLADKSCIFIAHYFGKEISEELVKAIKNWKSAGVEIIEDVTMSLFSYKPEYIGFGDYIIGSIRKWLPIPDGGFLCLKKNISINLPVMEEMGEYAFLYTIVEAMKKEYIEGGEQDIELKNTYLLYYKKAIDILFSDYRIRKITDMSLNYIYNQNYNDIIDKRIRNYDFLYEKLNKCKCLKPIVKREKNCVPFMLVAYSEDRDKLLNFFVQNDVYCNIHWRINSNEREELSWISEHIISLPCDQRYTLNDMQRIVDVANMYDKVE